MDALTFPKIATKIIKEQELVIGPLAWTEARKVQGLEIVNEKNGEVNIQNGDPKSIIDTLVGRYERIFGKASHMVCKEAAQSLIAGLSPDEVPSSLR